MSDESKLSRIELLKLKYRAKSLSTGKVPAEFEADFNRFVAENKAKLAKDEASKAAKESEKSC